MNILICNIFDSFYLSDSCGLNTQLGEVLNENEYIEFTVGTGGVVVSNGNLFFEESFLSGTKIKIQYNFETNQQLIYINGILTDTTIKGDIFEIVGDYTYTIYNEIVIIEPITISGARISYNTETITALNGYAGDMANNYFQAYYLIPALLVVGVASMLLNKVFGIFSFSK